MDRTWPTGKAKMTNDEQKKYEKYEVAFVERKTGDDLVVIPVPHVVVEAGRAVQRGARWFDALARRVVARVRGEP